MKVIETDARGRATITGHPDQRFIVQENADGSLLLQPATLVTEAQREYDTDPELQRLLAAATDSPTVRRMRRRREA